MRSRLNSTQRLDNRVQVVTLLADFFVAYTYTFGIN